MDHRKAPRPTEYRGVKYRSASEARFAWLLTHQDIFREGGALHPCLEHIYTPQLLYEPDWPDSSYSIDCGGWKPDFLALTFRRLLPNPFPRLHPIVIEYKPSKPTDTYIHECGERIAKFCDAWVDYRWPEFAEASRMLVYGSVYDEIKSLRCILYNHRGELVGENQCHVGDNAIELLNCYRFDLVDSEDWEESLRNLFRARDKIGEDSQDKLAQWELSKRKQLQYRSEEAYLKALFGNGKQDEEPPF